MMMEGAKRTSGDWSPPVESRADVHAIACGCTNFPFRWRENSIRNDYTIGALHYNWISHVHVCACDTGLQHVQCTDSHAQHSHAHCFPSLRTENKIYEFFKSRIGTRIWADKKIRYDNAGQRIANMTLVKCHTFKSQFNWRFQHKYLLSFRHFSANICNVNNHSTLCHYHKNSHKLTPSRSYKNITHVENKIHGLRH